MLKHESMRLNKFISESGLCSRREADRYIATGNVLINGRKATIGDKVGYKDKVMVNGQLLEPRAEENAIYLAFNKPVGIVSTTELTTKDNIISYINHSERIFPIGRLDKDSQGLIFLTSNGDIVNKILRAGNKHEKEYIVTVDKPITERFIEEMSGGVPILGVMTKRCTITRESANSFRIILIQGLNRQIRRMCEFFGYEVTKLERIRIMNVQLKGLPVGDWRELTENELSEIFSKLEHSSDEGKTKAKPKSKAKPKPKYDWDLQDSAAREAKPRRSTGGKPASTSSSKRIGKSKPTPERPAGPKGRSGSRVNKSAKPGGSGPSRGPKARSGSSSSGRSKSGRR